MLGERAIIVKRTGQDDREKKCNLHQSILHIRKMGDGAGTLMGGLYDFGSFDV